MLDDFTREQIIELSKNDPACVKALIGTIQESQRSLECSVNGSITKEEYAYVSNSSNDVVQSLYNDLNTKSIEQELEQKKIISGLIRQKFVSTAINIPNKTTESIVEWYLMVPSDTFLKYVEWYKENGYSF